MICNADVTVRRRFLADRNDYPGFGIRAHFKKTSLRLRTIATKTGTYTSKYPYIWILYPIFGGHTYIPRIPIKSPR